MSDAMDSSRGQNDILPHQWKSWTPEDVGRYFKVKGLPAEGVILTREQISGNQLPKMTEKRLKAIGVRTLGKMLSVMEIIHTLTRNFLKTKIFNDSIHGHIEFETLLIKIIDTPQFQRLRSIKQLGGGYFVFPGAAHNRFEHSLGVCYLAGEFARSLQRKQPELEITDKDILCVQIAGLCHDLGHGPFSHVFDLFVIPKIRPDFKHKHEHLSVLMFDHLINENHLEVELEKNGLDEKDRVFIREQIEGLPKDSSQKQYVGRDREKRFLYEIVANKENGIDVDKWDYFARDCYNLGIANSFDHKRYMKFARVIKVAGARGRKQICMRDKEASNLYEMFNMRTTLHRRAYQHKVNKIIEKMIVEALFKANLHLKIFPGSKKKKLTMSESLDDMHAYTHLTDSVLEHILFSQKSDLEESKDIIQKILTRQLYEYVGESPVFKKLEPELKIRKQICKAVSVKGLNGPQLDPDDLVVHEVKIDYGKGKNNPVDKVNFYSKNAPNKTFKIPKGQVSQMLPRKFTDHYIRLYCKDSKDSGAENVKKEKAYKCFAAWCKKNGLSKPVPDIFLDSKKRPREDETRTPSEGNRRRKKPRKN